MWSNSMEEHLEEVFPDALEVHSGKCVFVAHNIDFLGHCILANSSKPQTNFFCSIPTKNS